MHIHYFILRKIADRLNRDLVGGIFAEAFTQDKDQLMIGLGTPEQDIWLRVSCGAPLPYIWPMRQFSKARRNVLDLFPQLQGLRIQRVHAVPFERVLLIDLQRGYQLALKMHGLMSNVLVLLHGKVVDRFRQHSEADLEFVPTQGSFYEAAITDPSLEGNAVADRLRAISPVFEKQFASFVEAEMALGRTFAEAYAHCMHLVEDDRFYLWRRADRIQFLLFPPPKGEAVELEGLDHALHVFFKTWHQYQNYARVYEDVRKPLERHLARIQGQIDSYYLSIDTITHERPPEEIGHILMANLHQIQPGLKEVELQDFYHDKPISIKLKPELNPQQNAEQYYQKQKKHRARAGHLEEQIMRLEQELSAFEPARNAFATFPAPASLPIGPEGLDYSLLKRMNAFGAEYLPMIQSGKTDTAQPSHGFHEFKQDGYTILCGKNAKQNESLTFAYSRKDDLWLHARDTPGSHVIIRNPTAGPIPQSVLEFAASVAALYSKRKHENLVPVQYCERKYVRKLKGGQVGQVIVEREKVVMVEPMQKASR